MAWWETVLGTYQEASSPAGVAAGQGDHRLPLDRVPTFTPVLQAQMWPCCLQVLHLPTLSFGQVFPDESPMDGREWRRTLPNMS